MARTPASRCLIICYSFEAPTSSGPSDSWLTVVLPRLQQSRLASNAFAAATSKIQQAFGFTLLVDCVTMTTDSK